MSARDNGSLVVDTKENSRFGGLLLKRFDLIGIRKIDPTIADISPIKIVDL